MEMAAGKTGKVSCAALAVLALSSLLTVSGLSDPRTHPTPSPPPLSPRRPHNLLSYQVKKVSSTPVAGGDGGYDLGVQMRGPYPPDVYFMPVTDTLDEARHLGRPAADGVLRFHTATPVFVLIFLHPQGFQVLNIHIRVGPQQVAAEPTERVLPDVELFNWGGRNVIFARGSNASVSLTLKTSRDNSSTAREKFDFAMLVKDETESNAVNLHEQNSGEVWFPFANVSRSKNGDEENVHMVLETAAGGGEGLLQATWRETKHCRDDDEGPCMDLYYMASEQLPVFQRDHDGPFPEHFVGLLRFQQWAGGQPSHQTPELTPCHVGRSACFLYCFFVGDGPSAVRFQRVSGSLVPSRQWSLSNNGYMSVGALLFTPSASQAGREARYRCESGSGGTVVSHTTTLVVIHGATIDRERSGVSGGSGNSSVTVTCVAQGTPAPTLSIAANFRTPIAQALEPHLYILTHTQLDDTTTQATLRILHPADFQRFSQFTCRAANIVRGKQNVDYTHFRTISA